MCPLYKLVNMNRSRVNPSRPSTSLIGTILSYAAEGGDPPPTSDTDLQAQPRQNNNKTQDAAAVMNNNNDNMSTYTSQ
jgi:hypothetical protein